MLISHHIPGALDAVFAVIVLLFIMRGRRLGFARMLLSTAGVAAAAVAAKIAAAPAAAWIYENAAKRRLITYMAERMNETPGKGIDVLMAAVPDSIDAAADRYGLNLAHMFSSVDMTGTDNRQIAARVADTVLEPVLMPVLTLLAFVVLMIVLGGVFSGFVSGLSIFRKKDSLLSAADRVMGMLCGLIKGSVVAIAAALLCVVLATLFADSAIAQAAADSGVVSAVASFVI